MEKRELTASVILGLSAGVFGGVLGVGVASWLADRPRLLGGDWWEVTTALFTAAAVAIALVQAIKLAKAKQSEENSQAEGMLSLINETTESLSWLAEHISVRVAEKNEPIRHEVMAFLSSADMVERIPFYEQPYSKYHGALVHVISGLRSASHEVRELLERGLLMDVGEFKVKAKNTLDTFDRVLDDEVFRNLKKPPPAYILPFRKEIRIKIEGK